MFYCKFHCEQYWVNSKRLELLISVQTMPITQNNRRSQIYTRWTLTSRNGRRWNSWRYRSHVQALGQWSLSTRTHTHTHTHTHNIRHITWCLHAAIVAATDRVNGSLRRSNRVKCQSIRLSVRLFSLLWTNCRPLILILTRATRNQMNIKVTAHGSRLIGLGLHWG